MTAQTGTLRIGAGAGFAGDRIEPALELLEHGDLDYLVFECLAERTIALAQTERLTDPSRGYDPRLRERFSRALPLAMQRGVGLITNGGAANPRGAALAIAEEARALGLGPVRIASVTGDDVLDLMLRQALPLTDRAGTTRDLGELVSANAYLGALPVAQALAMGANVVVTGRIGDPALFCGPMLHRFGWNIDDAHLMGQATLIGHLLECAGQLCGGYFADPGFKDVPHLARLGFPLAEVSADGSAVLTKVAGTGGRVTPATCKEQLLYEILDPAAYHQADVIADFTGVGFDAIGPDRVAVTGGTGRPPSGKLKVSIGYRDGFIGEGQISYAGPGAVDRARLAGAIVQERLRLIGAEVEDVRVDLIGLDATDRRGPSGHEPAEVRLRVVGRAAVRHHALSIGAEVEALYTNGPAGGGGATHGVRPVVAVASTLIDAAQVYPVIEMHEVPR